MQDHVTSGDWLDCGSKKFIKTSAVPTFRTSWKKKSKKSLQRIRNRATDKCGSRLPAKVVNDDPNSAHQAHQDMLQSFEVSLKAEQNQLVSRRDDLETELQLLDQILSLRELESLEMEYGLESDVWW